MDELDDMLKGVEQGEVSPDQASKKIHGGPKEGRSDGCSSQFKDEFKKEFTDEFKKEFKKEFSGDYEDATNDSSKCFRRGRWRFEVTNEKKPFLSGLFFGIYLILQSVAIVLLNVGLLPATGSWWNAVWPVILFTMGSKMIVSEAIKGKFAIFGTAIAAIGVGRMLVNAAFINFTQWWSWFWPIILIIAGITLLIRALIGKNDWEVHFD